MPLKPPFTLLGTFAHSPVFEVFRAIDDLWLGEDGENSNIEVKHVRFPLVTIRLNA